jgi:hypothetical protein
MVLGFSLTSRINKRVGPMLLRASLSARYRLGGGVIRDNPYLDAFLFVPFAQTIISLETHDDAIQALSQASKKSSQIDQMADDVFDKIFGADKPDPNKRRTQEVIAKPASVNIRLKALESYLRPALVPHERWSDVERWRFHNRFLKWARAEFLLAKHGDYVRETVDLYPKLGIRQRKKSSFLKTVLVGGSSSDGADMGKKNGRLPLPSSSQLMKAFDMQNWNRTVSPQGGQVRMKKIAKQLGGAAIQFPGSSFCFASLPDETDVSSTSLEDLLELAGGHVAGCGPFNVVCEENEIWEFWTKDYVSTLASYLLDRTEEFGHGETLILDVGAGDGTLAHFLREFMMLEAKRRAQPQGVSSATRKRRPKRSVNPTLHENSLRVPQVLATDDGSWNLEMKADLEMLNVKDSMAKYGKKGHPDEQNRRQLIVLCSWMPMGEDWSADIRSGGADEYILIGESDDGNCGDNWMTWGNPDFFDSAIEGPAGRQNDEIATDMIPPYSMDGYVRTNLDELSKLQFSRFDSRESSTSSTVSFRQKQIDV